MEIPYVRQPIEFPARYAHGPDSFPQPGVPRGALHEYEWNESRVFPGTNRRFWVYVPAGYRESEPASLMVFQDAEWYLDLEFEARAPVVFDNLIHRGEMPVIPIGSGACSASFPASHSSTAATTIPR